MGVIKIYADGACRGNQFKENIGGYGIIMIYGNYKKEFKNAFKNVTNNQMELLSVITALKMLKQYDIPIEVYSDSQYVVNTINLNWKKNANKDLWEELYNILGKIKDIKFIKPKGHSDNIYNNRADQLANEAMDALK